MPVTPPSLRLSEALPWVYLLISLTAAAQSPAIPPPTPDVAALTRAAIARLDTARNAAHRFTDFDLAHNQNRNAEGKLYSDSTALYEDTWIADLPYKRLVAVDGHPLSGKDLEKESRRYDDAVRDRVALDDAARARITHERFMEAGLDLDALTSTGYHLAFLHEADIDGHPAAVIDATPVAPAFGIHYTLWIATSDPELLRFTFNVLSDTPRLLRGSFGQKNFLSLEGTPLPSHSSIHALVLVGHKTITVDSEHTYTKYRRFSTTTTMLPSPGTTPAQQM